MTEPIHPPRSCVTHAHDGDIDGTSRVATKHRNSLKAAAYDTVNQVNQCYMSSLQILQVIEITYQVNGHPETDRSLVCSIHTYVFIYTANVDLQDCASTNDGAGP